VRREREARREVRREKGRERQEEREKQEETFSAQRVLNLLVPKKIISQYFGYGKPP